MGIAPQNRWVIIKDDVIAAADGHYVADPFHLDGFLFFEYYDYHKGVIAILENAKIKVVLERPYHLSFPCVFKDHGDYYMLPETVNNGQLELYKAKNFPYGWELVKIIAPGWFDDPVIYLKNGYEIFTTQGANNLKVLSSRSLLGDWAEVHSDASKQYRSAGHIFEKDGKVIRPCQDCEGSYGRGIIFYELNGFSHKEIGRYDLGGATGCHTFNQGYIDARFPYETDLDTIRQVAGLRRPLPYQD